MAVVHAHSQPWYLRCLCTTWIHHTCLGRTHTECPPREPTHNLRIHSPLSALGWQHPRPWVASKGQLPERVFCDALACCSTWRLLLACMRSVYIITGLRAGERYHLYVSYACPWACRVLAVLYMKVPPRPMPAPCYMSNHLCFQCPQNAVAFVAVVLLAFWLPQCHPGPVQSCTSGYSMLPPH